MKGSACCGEVTASGAGLSPGRDGGCFTHQSISLAAVRCSQMAVKGLKWVFLAFRFGWDEALMAPLRQV